ncbi:MAG: DUF4197 domain-containing protein [Actinomycetota bacterium]|nr:DUF4197 domain-containing protein [Actinomycetota bacterium]
MKTTTSILPAFLLVTFVLALAACAGADKPGLTRDDSATLLVNRGVEGDAADGIRALLLASAQRATADLSRPNGYQRYDDTRLPLPAAADATVSMLRAYGYGQLAEPVQMDINRGAEIGAGKALPVLADAIAQLEITDVGAVVNGGDSAATQLLCGRGADSEERAKLLRSYATALTAGLAEAGYYSSLKILVDKYNSIPILSDISGLDLEAEIRERGLNGICLRMASEEARMRNDPAQRPGEAINRLFIAPH